MSCSGVWIAGVFAPLRSSPAADRLEDFGDDVGDGAVEVAGLLAGDAADQEVGAAARVRGPFAAERGHGHLEAVTDLSDAGVVGDTGVSEEGFVELRPPVHLADGTDLDARLVDVDDEIRHAPMLGNVDVGPGHEQAPVGDGWSRSSTPSGR